MRMHRDELARIGSQSAEPTFDNTVTAFDATGQLLSSLEALFHSLTASATSDGADQ